MTVGREKYSRYYYLWHLVAIKALKVSAPEGGDSDEDDGDDGDSPASGGCPLVTDTAWEGPNNNENITVGLIDMGVARHHPNLEPKADDGGTEEPRVLWDKALDLSSHPFGVTTAALDKPHLENPKQHLLEILNDNDLKDDITGGDAEFIEILENLRVGWGVEREVEKYAQSFATHGTACAGLVSGTSYDDQVGNIGNIAVYYGVDPYSKIIPITTSISADPYQLIAAFLYARAQDVDVILFPRDAADPKKMPASEHLDAGEKNRLYSSPEIELAWRLFERVIIHVSKKIPVVCAAGNDGRSELIYPASLAAENSDEIEEGEDTENGIIAVGSVSYLGYRSGYSNYGSGLTVVAPSDDGEVYNRHQIRLDRQAEAATDFWVKKVHSNRDIEKIPFSAARLVTLDVPGPRGYASGSRAGLLQSRKEAVDDPGGLYTEIGGTSGAAAIVAGAVALMQRKDKRTGIEIKNALQAMGGPNRNISHWYWLDGTYDELRLDAINGESTPNAQDLFGEGGLIDVEQLLS